MVGAYLSHQFRTDGSQILPQLHQGAGQETGRGGDMKIALTLLLVGAAISGAPLFVVISAVALLWFYFMGIDLSIVIIEMYRLASNPLLIALLFFAFAGYILAESGAGKRLVKLSTLFSSDSRSACS